jgi:hypothetical protein
VRCWVSVWGCRLLRSHGERCESVLQLGVGVATPHARPAPPCTALHRPAPPCTALHRPAPPCPMLVDFATSLPIRSLACLNVELCSPCKHCSRQGGQGRPTVDYTRAETSWNFLFHCR